MIIVCMSFCLSSLLTIKSMHLISDLLIFLSKTIAILDAPSSFIDCRFCAIFSFVTLHEIWKECVICNSSIFPYQIIILLLILVSTLYSSTSVSNLSGMYIIYCHVTSSVSLSELASLKRIMSSLCTDLIAAVSKPLTI